MQLCCTRGKSRARSIARFCLQYQRNGSSRFFLCKYMYKDTEREGARQSKQVKSHRLVHFSFWFLLLLYPLLITLWSQGVNQGVNCTHLLLSFFFFRLYHEREGKRERERGGGSCSHFEVQRTSRFAGLVSLNTRCNATSCILHLVSLIRGKRLWSPGLYTSATDNEVGWREGVGQRERGHSKARKTNEN